MILLLTNASELLLFREMREGNSSRQARQGSDSVMEELLLCLSDCQEVLYFQDIFYIVYAGLKERNAATGGEEMMKLRIYEKLQILVSNAALKKIGKEYTVTPQLAIFIQKRQSS